MTDEPTMRASVFLEPNRIEVHDVPAHAPGEGLVRFRVEACGVCGTDYHIYAGELTDRIFPPVVLGHEIAVRAEEIGEGVEGVEAGDFGAIDPVIGCGQCTMCHAGRPNLCPDATIIGYKLDGGFAQYLLAPPEQFVPMRESVGPGGAVLCETLACVLNGYERLDFRAGGSAMILGAGTVGLLWAQMLASSPCRFLIQTEIEEFRKGKAVRLGADLVIDPLADDLPGRVRTELPEGVDYIIDATGEPAAIQQALPLLAPGGTLLIFGVCPEGSAVTFDPNELYAKEAKIIASRMPPHKLDRAARLIEAGRIAVDEIVTDTRSLDDAADAIAAFNDHRDAQVKVAIDPWA